MSDLLAAIHHLVKHSNFQLPSTLGIGGADTIVSGKPFEIYCKDWLSLLPPGNISQRAAFYERSFSYQGSDNNPPDVMFKGGNKGDAFEFKKTQSLSASLPLNSSFPKNKLFISSPGLLDSCITCEHWSERNFYYIIGQLKPNDQRVASLWVVDGELMAGEHTVYETIFSNLQNTVSSFVASNNLERINSVELGRLRGIDELNKTVLRVRSMWELETPQKSFKDVEGVILDPQKSVLHALIMDSKWQDYPPESQQLINALVGLSGFTLKQNIELPDPKNKDNKLKCHLIRFES